LRVRRSSPPGRVAPRRPAVHRQIMEESQQRIRSEPAEQRTATRAAEQDRWEAALRLAVVLDHRLALDLAILADDLALRLDAPDHPAGAADDPAAALRARVVALVDRTGTEARP